MNLWFFLIQGNNFGAFMTFSAGHWKCVQTIKDTTVFFMNISNMFLISLKNQTYININFQIIYREFI